MRTPGRRSNAAPGWMLGLFLAWSMGAAGEDVPYDNFVHWAYSAYFGTGWYQVGDDQQVFALRVAPGWHWGDPGLGEDGGRSVGIDFRLPITVGLHDVDTDDLPSIVDVDNFGTVSVTPGIEVEVPITAQWSLKPLAYLGWGTELEGSQSAWIYWGGLKSRYRFRNGSLDWSVVNSLTYVGYTPDDGPSSDAVPVMAGLEFRWPWGNQRFNDRPVYIDSHMVYTAYLDDLDFLLGGVSRTRIADEWELGVALSHGEDKIKIGFLEFDRLGLAYRFSTSGDFEGVSFVLRSVFDR